MRACPVCGDINNITLEKRIQANYNNQILAGTIYRLFCFCEHECEFKLTLKEAEEDFFNV